MQSLMKLSLKTMLDRFFLSHDYAHAHAFGGEAAYLRDAETWCTCRKIQEHPEINSFNIERRQHGASHHVFAAASPPNA